MYTIFQDIALEVFPVTQMTFKRHSRSMAMTLSNKSRYDFLVCHMKKHKCQNYELLYSTCIRHHIRISSNLWL